MIVPSPTSPYLNDLLDLSTEFLLALAPTGTILSINRSACQALKFQPNELLGSDIHALIHADSKEAFSKAMAQLWEAREAIGLSFKMLSKAGVSLDVRGQLSGRFTDGSCEAVFLRLQQDSVGLDGDAARWQSVSLYRLFVETLNEGIAVWDESARITFVNDRLCEMLGYDRDALQGKLLSELLADPNQDISIRYENMRRGDLQEPYELKFARKDGGLVPTLVSPKPLFDGHGVFKGHFDIISDLSRQERVERERPESQLRFRSLMDHAADAFFIHDMDGRFREVNQHACTSLGFTRDELLEMSVRDVEVGADEGPLRAIWSALEPGSPMTLQGEHCRKDGTTFPVETRLGRFAFGGTPLFIALVRDVTERKRADEQLLRYQRQLRSMASKLSLAEERERRRIAADLHDHIAQNLVLSRIKLGAFHESLPAAFHAEPLVEVRNLLEQVIQDTRTLIFEISPPILYELGLAPAIEWLAELVGDQVDLSCKVEDDGEEKPLSEDVRVVLFQAVRELLINVIKHAKASRATVNLRKAGDMIRVAVRDNGKGMGVRKLPVPAAKKSGFGLFHIRDRLDLLGGRLEVESPPGKGTTVVLFAPLKVEGES